MPDGVLLQLGPKGSYRSPQLLSFLDWAMPSVAGAAETQVVVLDWLAPHLDPTVDAAMREKNHSVLRIGGGLTGDVQVGDTHRHGPYSKAYRAIETADAARELRLRPNRLPRPPDCLGPGCSSLEASERLRPRDGVEGERHPEWSRWVRRWLLGQQLGWSVASVAGGTPPPPNLARACS